MASAVASEARRLEVSSRWQCVYWCAGALVLCLVAAGCGGRDDEGALRWSVFKQLGPHKAILAGEVGYCVGEPKPRVEKVVRSYSGRRVLLTLFLGRRQPKPQDCRGVGLAVFKTVSFRRNLAQLELLDASTDPPERRWPTSG
jgi:hypothetical protein